jgi:hypothetical protein
MNGIRQRVLIGVYSTWRLNTLNAELNPICHLLALLGAHHILHVSRVRVKYTCYRYLWVLNKILCRLWKLILCFPYKMRIRKRRFCFFLLQLPSNVTLVVCGEYLFCPTVHCTIWTACSMLQYRNATEI